MSEKKEYRNAARSRRLIRQAFMELLHEKPFEKITATDVIRRADINRSTFYAHYPDVRGIIEEIQGEIISLCRGLLSNTDFSAFFEDPTSILQNAMSVLTKNQELYKLLGQSPATLLMLDEMKKALIDVTVNAESIPEDIRTNPAFIIEMRFFYGGIVDVYRQWLSGELDCELDALTDVLAVLIADSSKKLISPEKTDNL